MQKMKQFVVYLRYNKLNEPGPKWHTYRQISEITGVKLNSVLSIVLIWRKNVYRIINRRLGQRPRAKWQTPEIISYLTNHKILTEWAHLPLSARVVLLE
jgi:hypothetical protein